MSLVTYLRLTSYNDQQRAHAMIKATTVIDIVGQTIVKATQINNMKDSNYER